MGLYGNDSLAALERIDLVDSSAESLAQTKSVSCVCLDLQGQVYGQSDHHMYRLSATLLSSLQITGPGILNRT